MELTIPATPVELAGLRQAARHALREVPPEIAEELVLALDEAATNAILHGSRGGDPVQVAVWVRDDWVEATVVDHGRGLWLLDRLVDEVRVERAKLGTRVTLRRRVRSPSRPMGGGGLPSAGRAFS